MAWEQVKLLYKGICEGDETSVKTLIHSGVDVNLEHRNEIALTFALQQNPLNVHIITSILESSNFNPNAVNRWSRTPLFVASLNGNAALIKPLLDLGADIEKCDNSKVSPLGATAYYNQYEAAKILIEAGADINTRDASGETPLYRACKYSSTEVAEILLKNSCDINIKTHKNETSLMATVESHSPKNNDSTKRTSAIDIMRQLLNKECDLDVQNNCGETALHMAVIRNDTLTTGLLLDSGANFTITNDDNYTPFHIALLPERQYYRIAILFILFGCNLKSILSKNNINVLQLLLEGGKKPLSSNHERRLFLKLFLYEMQYTPCELQVLLPTLFSGNENTDEKPLHHDVILIRNYVIEQKTKLQNICRKIIRGLLGQNIMAKVDQLPISVHLKNFLTYGLNSTRLSRECELQLAIEEGNNEALLAAIKSGADVNSNLFGNTPLLHAAEFGKEDVLNMLLEHGANPGVRDQDGDTVLHVLSRRGHKDILLKFLENGCEVNTKNEIGNLAIHESSCCGKFFCVQLLIEFGSLVNIPDKNGIYPIHYAAVSGDSETVKQLLTKCASANVVDSKGYAPIHLAVTLGVLYLENNISVPALFESELAMNLRMMNLMYRPTKFVQHSPEDKSKFTKVIHELMKFDCAKDIETSTGQTARDLAVEYGFCEVLEILSTHHSNNF